MKTFGLKKSEDMKNTIQQAKMKTFYNKELEWSKRCSCRQEYEGITEFSPTNRIVRKTVQARIYEQLQKNVV